MFEGIFAWVLSITLVIVPFGLIVLALFLWRISSQLQTLIELTHAGQSQDVSHP